MYLIFRLECALYNSKSYGVIVHCIIFIIAGCIFTPFPSTLVGENIWPEHISMVTMPFPGGQKPPVTLITGGTVNHLIFPLWTLSRNDRNAFQLGTCIGWSFDYSCKEECFTQYFKCSRGFICRGDF